MQKIFRNKALNCLAILLLSLILLFSFTSHTAPTASAYTLGDVNNDGRIDVQDVTLVTRHVIGIEDLSASQMEAADVNGDGQINVQDVTLVMQKALGKIDKFPVKTGLDFERPDLYDLPYEVKALVDDMKRMKISAQSQTYEYNNSLYIIAVYEAPYIAYGWMTITHLTEKDEKLNIFKRVTKYPRDPDLAYLPAIEILYDVVVIEDPGMPVEFKTYFE